MDLLIVVDRVLDSKGVSDLEGDKALLFFAENVQGFCIGIELFNLITRSRGNECLLRKERTAWIVEAHYF